MKFKNKKRIFPLLAAILLVLTIPTGAYGEGKVSYQGSAEKFVFSPGSEFSPSDLFTDLKNVMPGDSITQKIVVKNDASQKVKAKIYLRSLGGRKGSEAILSKMKLRVTQDEDSVLFDASAGEKAQLEQWVLLGTLYSGGEAQLTLNLDVPVDLANDFQDAVGYLDWQFKVEEFPEQPEQPETGDRTSIAVLAGAMVLSIGGVIGIAICLKKRKHS